VVHPLSRLPVGAGSAIAEEKLATAEATKTILKNKKAFFHFEVEERLETGIELVGTEVKSVKSGRFSFADSYARIRKGEVWLYGLHIAEYTHGNLNNHEPARERRLLLHKQEIKRLRKKVDQRGYTLVPLSLYLKHGVVKVELGLCKGKTQRDKREAIKQKDLKREEQRELKWGM
jgi:SsrA-binding protein